jgi:hypothetical protein
MNICGFILVRRREENCDPLGKGIWPRHAPHVRNIFYGGVWRMPWCDLEFERYAGKLPAELSDLYLANVTDLQGSSLALCRELDIAKQFLGYCNRDQRKCELIAVHSPKLASIKGTIDVDDVLLEAGWEPFQIGGGSLLVDGVFAAPDRFPNWKEKLNANGLLSSLEECGKYILEYQRLAGAGLLEELFPVRHHPIESVEVFSLTTLE